jgi:hypothetical protein
MRTSFRPVLSCLLLGSNLASGPTPTLAASPQAPVIFVHGIFGSWRTWRAFADYLTNPNGPAKWQFGGCPTKDDVADCWAGCAFGGATEPHTLGC